MEPIKLFDSELRLMEIIWSHAPVTAKKISSLAATEIGWNKNTTYTVIKKLIDKKAINRSEPNFVCEPLLSREQVQLDETRRLIDKLYEGSIKTFFASFVQKEKLTDDELAELKRIIDEKS